MPHTFNIGCLVISGPILRGVEPSSDCSRPCRGMPRYRVFHAPGDLRDYDEEQFVPASHCAAPDSPTEAIAAGRWLDAEDFKARLTAARLAHPQIDHIYALHAARIQFIPFQFKPLLRFLRADRPRLLIADEVGVGKTIEAGLILKELQTRQRVENVLIVCPKALVASGGRRCAGSTRTSARWTPQP